MLPLGVLGEAILRTPREQRRLGRGRDPPAADLLHALLATLPRAPLIRPRSRGDRARRLFRSVVAAAVVEAARRRRRRAAGTALLRFRPTTTARRRRRAASAAGFARDASAGRRRRVVPAPPGPSTRTSSGASSGARRPGTRVVGPAAPRRSSVSSIRKNTAQRRPETASPAKAPRGLRTRGQPEGGVRRARARSRPSSKFAPSVRAPGGRGRGWGEGGSIPAQRSGRAAGRGRCRRRGQPRARRERIARLSSPTHAAYLHLWPTRLRQSFGLWEHARPAVLS